MLKNKNGITLIALVISIIVLLILAAISLSITFGNNGILTQAVNSVDRNKESQAIEEVEMAWAAATAEYWSDWATNSGKTIGENLTKAKLDEYLKDKGTIERDPIYDGENKEYTLIYKPTGQNESYPLVVTEDGKVSKKILPKLSSVVKVGEYVDLNIGYRDTRNNKSYLENDIDKAWRVMDIEDGSVKLISTGHPLTFNYSGNNPDLYVTKMKTIETGNIDSAYTANGFNTSNVTELFNNHSVVVKIALPRVSDIESSRALDLNASRELMKTGYSYWLGESRNNFLARVDKDGSHGASSGDTRGIRLMVYIQPNITIRYGTGEETSPYKIEGISYE